MVALAVSEVGHAHPWSTFAHCEPDLRGVVGPQFPVPGGFRLRIRMVASIAWLARDLPAF